MPIVKIWGPGFNEKLNCRIKRFLESLSELDIQGKDLVLIINPDHYSSQENVISAEITVLNNPEITETVRKTIATGVAYDIQSFYPYAKVISTVFPIQDSQGSCILEPKS